MKKIFLLLLISLGINAQQAVNVPETFTVPVAVTNGGTGLTALTASAIPFAGAANTLSTSTLFKFSGVGLQLGSGTMYGTVPMEMSRASLGSDIYIRNNLASGQSNLFFLDGIGLSNAFRMTLHGSTFSSSGLQQANTGALFTVGTSIHLNAGTFGNAEFRIWTNNTQYVTVNSSGRTFFGGSTLATALVHIGAKGVTTASGGPLKLTVAGSSLVATPEAGLVETDANGAIYWTPAASRYQVATCLTGSAALDFPSTIAGAVSDLTLTVTGAADGDVVSIGKPNGSSTTTGIYTGWVSATNVVTVRFSPKATEDPASGTFKVVVNKN